MTITVTHPLDTKNFTGFSLNGYSFWFSYDTCIAFTTGEGIHISENCWSTTTGKHLNWINIDKSLRLPRSEFEELLDKHLEDIDDALLFVRRGATPAQIDNAILRLQQMTREMTPPEEGNAVRGMSELRGRLAKVLHDARLKAHHELKPGFDGSFDGALADAILSNFLVVAPPAEEDDEYELPDEFKPYFAPPPAEGDDYLTKMTRPHVLTEDDERKVADLLASPVPRHNPECEEDHNTAPAESDEE